MAVNSKKPSQHIGLFGGSFNPVHTGHITAAKSVASQLQLDSVIFIPAAYSPFKNKPEISDHHRVRMLELALAKSTYFSIDQRELTKPGPSYTIDTINSISKEMPDAQLYLLLGMDAWHDLEQWKDWQTIAQKCHIVVMTRPNYVGKPLSNFWQSKLVNSRAEIRKHKHKKLLFIDVPPDNAASSAVRENLHQDNPTRDALHGDVASYIQEHMLYQK